MCNLETEGTKYGCGHYKVTKKVAKIDCKNQWCTHSVYHLPNCANCEEGRCERFFGPDAKETITLEVPDYCNHCQYWFKGPGSIPRR